MNPESMSCQQEASASFEDVATSSSNYAQRFAGPLGAWLLERQTDILQGFLAQVPGIASSGVLDVGGGHGQVAHPLCAQGLRVTVQASAESCREQIKDLLQAGLCEFRVSDPLALPWEPGSFAAVTCFRFLPHIDNWRGLIGELCRVSSHSVIVDYPPLISFNLMYPLLFGLKKKLEGNTRQFTLFQHHEISETFAKHGFKLQKRHGEFFWPMVLHRVLKNPSISELLEALPRGVGLSDLFGSPVIGHFVRDNFSR